MKTLNRLSFILSIIILSIIVTPLKADPPGMPGTHGEAGDQIPGGGAPVGSGMVSMLVLSGLYLWKKKEN